MPSMIASPKISTGTDCASDASNDPTPNSAAPMMKIRRAPKRSARRPPMIRRLANVSEYPVITHCRLGSVVWRSRRIVGMATFSTVVSSATMSTDRMTIASVNQRRGSGAPVADSEIVRGARHAPDRRWCRHRPDTESGSRAPVAASAKIGGVPPRPSSAMSSIDSIGPCIAPSAPRCCGR